MHMRALMAAAIHCIYHTGGGRRSMTPASDDKYHDNIDLPHFT